MHPSIDLHVEACLVVHKVAHCIKKVCKGGEMLWYGYTFKVVKGVKVEVVQPSLLDHKMTDDVWPTSSAVW